MLKASAITTAHIESQLTCNTGKDAPGSKSVSRSALLHDIGTPQVALESQLCTFEPLALHNKHAI